MAARGGARVLRLAAVPPHPPPRRRVVAAAPRARRADAQRGAGRGAGEAPRPRRRTAARAKDGGEPEGDPPVEEADEDEERLLRLVGTIVASAGITGTLAVLGAALLRVDPYGHFSLTAGDAQTGLLWFTPLTLWTAAIFVVPHAKDSTMETYRTVQCQNNPAVGFTALEELLIIVLIELADNMLNRATVLGGGGKWLADRFTDAGNLAFDAEMDDGSPIWLGLSATQVAQLGVLGCAIGWKVGSELRSNMMRNELLNRMAEALKEAPDFLGPEKTPAAADGDAEPTPDAEDAASAATPESDDGVPKPVRPLTKLNYKDAQEILSFRKRIDDASTLDAAADVLKLVCCGGSFIVTQNLWAPVAASIVGQILYSAGQRFGLAAMMRDAEETAARSIEDAAARSLAESLAPSSDRAEDFKRQVREKMRQNTEDKDDRGGGDM